MLAEIRKRIAALEALQQDDDRNSCVLLYHPGEDIDVLVSEFKNRHPGVKTILCIPDNGRERCPDHVSLSKLDVRDNG